VAVGLEHAFAQRLTGYAGFRTDFSAKEAGSADNSSLSVWDIYHLSAGATMKIGKTDLTLGTIFAFGSKLTDTGIDLSPGDPNNGQLLPENLKARFTRLTFILGFSIGY